MLSSLAINLKLPSQGNRGTAFNNKQAIMKKIIASAILLAIAVQSFCQQTDSLKSIAKTDYLRKSKNQKTAAWILLGGGIAMAVAGTIVYSNDYNKAAEQDPFWTTVSYGANVNPTGAVIATLGVLAAVGSIPLFIASGKNKKKARAISTGFKMENALSIQRASLVSGSYPALSLRLSL
jgi:hypothetical protein